MTTLRAEVHAQSANGEAIAGVTVPVTGSASAPWKPASSPLWNLDYFAVLTVVGGPAYVAIGDTADPTVEPRTLVVPGQRVAVRISGANKLSAIAASDITG